MALVLAVWLSAFARLPEPPPVFVSPMEDRCGWGPGTLTIPRVEDA
jgi:hypothetical protein